MYDDSLAGNYTDRIMLQIRPALADPSTPNHNRIWGIVNRALHRMESELRGSGKAAEPKKINGLLARKDGIL